MSGNCRTICKTSNGELEQVHAREHRKRFWRSRTNSRNKGCSRVLSLQEATSTRYSQVLKSIFVCFLRLYHFMISALNQQNAAKTSADQIREDQIGRQLGRQRSSLDRIQQSSNVKQLSNDLQNLQRGISASSQARTQERVLEESNKFTQQGLQQGALLTSTNINTLLAGKDMVVRFPDPKSGG